MPSIEKGKINIFHIADYVMFVLILLVSATIGFYFAWTDRKKQTIKEYMLAGGNMQMMPVALSLLASFMSAITLLGTPVEMYLYNTVYVWIGVAYIFVMGAAAHIYIPVFYRLHITSSFEYLSLRFGKGIRTIMAIVYIFQMMLYMAIVLYAPSLALNAVTGIDLWGSIISVGLICTVYTAFGGMKAVLWTDCFQVGMMLAGYMAVLIQGSIKLGGFSKGWEAMENSGRVLFAEFAPDITVRHSVWSLTIGAFTTWIAVYGCNQAMVQRACSLPTLRRAQKAFWLNVPGLWLILYLGCMIGVVMYGYYAKCDPVTSGIISKADQLLPLYVMDVLGEVRGLPGLFVAGLFSGALSTVSSGLNAVAAVFLKDIIQSFFIPDMTDIRATRMSQALALIFGFICLGLTWVASQLGNVLQAALALYGMLSGPSLGAFTLGMLCPHANEKGAIVGVLTSMMFIFSIGMGNFIHKPAPNPPHSPVSTFGCGFNVTLAVKKAAKAKVSDFFNVSYLWYGTIVVIWIAIVGMAVSAATGLQNPEKLDPRLICPIFDIIPPFRWLPEKYRKILRFGVNHEGRYDDDGIRKVELERLGSIKVDHLMEMTLTVSSPVSTAHGITADGKGEVSNDAPLGNTPSEERVWDGTVEADGTAVKKPPKKKSSTNVPTKKKSSVTNPKKSGSSTSERRRSSTSKIHPGDQEK
ncbi:sodium-coupled monocarboxylate transporter 2-like [Littorina saxatilis]|uniref:sodium-coupled monocarboxylate transporter 2-like n=1 Tax=Littorina saxatilis TaxID=31220 RepID=UPI0038B46697